MPSSAPSGPIALLERSFRSVLPQSTAEVERWRTKARAIPDPELRKQALASLSHKRFHADGGSVYATALRGAEQANLVRLIVAFQTISDYLDNLCDRSTSLDGDDFRTLHQSMLDSVQPSAPATDYYALHPERDDGGYLADLVTTCQRGVAELPSHATVLPTVTKSVGVYCDLQVHKHVAPRERIGRLRTWFDDHSPERPGIDWWEFAAATGSTLLVFALFLAATAPALGNAEVDALAAAYFPWICGTHILLDYLIDQDEDLVEGDLNFVAQYPSELAARHRIEHFVVKAKARARALPDPRFHQLIVDGLLGMYLSDPKIARSGRRRFAWRLLRTNGRNALLFTAASRAYRAIAA